MSRKMSRRTVVLAAVVVLLGIVGAAAGVLVNRVRGPEWSAETGIMIKLASPDVVLLTGLTPTVELEDLIDAAAVAKSQTVLTRAAAKMGSWYTLADLSEQIAVEPVGSSHIIKVTAKTPDRDLSIRTADAVASAYVEVTQEQLKATTDALQTVPRPPDPGRQGGSDITADVRSRAVILGQDVAMAEIIHTEDPKQTSPSITTPIALGIVGVAAGALGAVIVTLLRPAAGSRRRRRSAAGENGHGGNGYGANGSAENGLAESRHGTNGHAQHRSGDATDPVST
jgi:capsular polysaccharide biosynthesis protein